MKVKFRRTGKFVILSTVLLVAAALIMSCPVPLPDFSSFNQSFPSKDGGTYLQLIIADSVERTILPDDTQPFAAYKLEFTGYGDSFSTDFDIQILATELNSPVNLQHAGTFSLVVTAYTDTGYTIEAATSTAQNETIATGTSNTITVTLNAKAIDNTTQGTFAWDIDLTGVNFTSGQLIIREYANPATVLHTFTLVEDDENEGTQALTSGYYYVDVDLAKTGATYNQRNVLHVYPRLTSTFTPAPAITDTSFGTTPFNVVFSFENSNANQNETKRVLPGGTVSLPTTTPTNPGFEPYPLTPWWTKDSGGDWAAEFTAATVVNADTDVFYRWVSTVSGTVSISLTPISDGMPAVTYSAAEVYGGTVSIVVTPPGAGTVTYEWLYHDGTGWVTIPTTNAATTSFTVNTTVAPFELEPLSGTDVIYRILIKATVDSVPYNAEVVITVTES